MAERRSGRRGGAAASRRGAAGSRAGGGLSAADRRPRDRCVEAGDRRDHQGDAPHAGRGLAKRGGARPEQRSARRATRAARSSRSSRVRREAGGGRVHRAARVRKARIVDSLEKKAAKGSSNPGAFGGAGRTGRRRRGGRQRRAGGEAAADVGGRPRHAPRGDVRAAPRRREGGPRRDHRRRPALRRAARGHRDARAGRRRLLRQGAIAAAHQPADVRARPRRVRAAAEHARRRRPVGDLGDQLAEVTLRDTDSVKHKIQLAQLRSGRHAFKHAGRRPAENAW